MELQWPLIIFTTLVAWSAGLFASQCILAFKGEAKNAQLPALIASFVLLVVGGIAVFFHLQHWERIFNGFGHITSGITQELIAIVVLVIVMLVFFIQLRKGSVSKAVSVVGIVVSVALVIVMAHSYMMPARPAWNTPLWVLAVLGNACAFGPLTMALIVNLKKGEGDAAGILHLPMILAGVAVNALTTVAYTVQLALTGGSISVLEFYADPNRFGDGIFDAAQRLNVFGGEMLAPTLLAVVCVLAAIGGAVLSKKLDAKVSCAISLVLVFVGALCIRVLFYQMGATFYPFF